MNRSVSVVLLALGLCAPPALAQWAVYSPRFFVDEYGATQDVELRALDRQIISHQLPRLIHSGESVGIPIALPFREAMTRRIDVSYEHGLVAVQVETLLTENNADVTKLRWTTALAIVDTTGRSLSVLLHAHDPAWSTDGTTLAARLISPRPPYPAVPDTVATWSANGSSWTRYPAASDRLYWGRNGTLLLGYGTHVYGLRPNGNTTTFAKNVRDGLPSRDGQYSLRIADGIPQIWHQWKGEDQSMVLANWIKEGERLHGNAFWAEGTETPTVLCLGLIDTNRRNGKRKVCNVLIIDVAHPKSARRLEGGFVAPSSCKEYVVIRNQGHTEFLRVSGILKR